MPLRRNRDVDIQPGGSFHLPAAQEANVGRLLSIFNKKEATEALTEMAKMDKDTWGSVKDTVTGLKDLVIGGGISAIKEEIRAIVKEEAMGIFGPILNEFQPIITELWEAFEPIRPYIVDAIIWIVTVIKPGIEGIVAGIEWVIKLLTGQLPTASTAEFLDLLEDLGFPVPDRDPQSIFEGIAGQDLFSSGDSTGLPAGAYRPSTAAKLDSLEDPYGDY